MPDVSTPPRKVWSMSVIVKNVTSSWASILVGIAIAFVLAPLTVRSLGDLYYGIWTLLMQLTGYLWLFDFGVRESVVKYVAQYHASDDHEQVNATVNTAVSIYSLVSLATLALSALLAWPCRTPSTSRPSAVDDRPPDGAAGRRHRGAVLRLQRLRRHRRRTAEVLPAGPTGHDLHDRPRVLDLRPADARLRHRDAGAAAVQRWRWSRTCSPTGSSRSMLPYLSLQLGLAEARRSGASC